jgi:adenosylcobinamide-phosphate synthase
MALQRFANTADAMWGYRGAWEWKGKWAARVDDGLNWIPARLTAALLWKRGMLWKDVRQQASQTESPNAGWPMACLALGLGVRLEKAGHYVLHPQGREPEAADVYEGLRLVRRAGWVALGVVFGVSLLLEMTTR